MARLNLVSLPVVKRHDFVERLFLVQISGHAALLVLRGLLFRLEYRVNFLNDLLLNRLILRSALVVFDVNFDFFNCDCTSSGTKCAELVKLVLVQVLAAGVEQF